MSIKVAIFGTGITGNVAYEYLSANEKYKVDCAITWDGSKIGEPVFDNSVYVRDINGLDKSIKVIVAVGKQYRKNVKKRIKGLGFETRDVDEFIFGEEKQRLDTARDCLYDDYSKSLFDELIRFRISDDIVISSKYFSDNQYFAMPEFAVFLTNAGGYVDAGAYVGDTFEKYISRCLEINKPCYLFEPGEQQYRALQKRCKRIQEEWALDDGIIRTYNSALYSLGGWRSPKGVLSSFSLGNIEESVSLNTIKVEKLDDIVDTDVEFIKADIEGSELAMLHGAVATIRKYKPKLAICIYHKPQDFYEIPEYIKSLVSEYKFAIRHHSLSFTETVLYCWV